VAKARFRVFWRALSRFSAEISEVQLWPVPAFGLDATWLVLQDSNMSSKLTRARAAAPIAQLSLFPERASLVCADPAKNMWRFYRMEVWAGLLGGLLLMRQWGRIGSKGYHLRQNRNEVLS
jgi:hypothetical protein